MTEMKRFFYAVLAVAATLSFAACSQENDINTPGASGKNTLAFTVGAATRAEAGMPAVKQGELISLGEPVDNNKFFLEETVVSLDDPSFFETAETRGTPAYTENFLNLSGGKFQALAFPAETMTGQKEWYSTFPRTSYGVKNTNNFADFEKKGDFWEYSYPWDPWYDQETLLFFAKMVVNESTAFSGPELGQNIGVLRNSYEFTYDGTAPTMSFSYRSQLTAQEQQDILFAARPVTKAESRKAIPILFYHPLTGVKFATAWANDGDVKTYIKRVELTGLYGYGKCYVTSTTENGGYSDDTATHSSASAVRWDFTVSGASNTLSNVYYQDYPDDYVTYTGGSFTSKGDYPNSFSAAGNKQNLNDGDATMTFWFPAQKLTSATKLTVTFQVEVKGNRKTYTRELNLGELTNNDEWKAGQLRTFTLKPNEVNIDIYDEVSGYKKDNVQIRNTGNVDAFIRATVVANWWAFTQEGEEGVAMGYVDDQGSAFVTPWSMSWDASASKYVDNYGGEFTGLPVPGATTGWVRAQDGFFYYTKAVPPGKLTGEPAAEDPLFAEYNLNTTDHPVPHIYYLDASVKEYDKVHLKMEIPVQAIEAKEGVHWDEAWAAVLGSTNKPVAQ